MSSTESGGEPSVRPLSEVLDSRVPLDVYCPEVELTEGELDAIEKLAYGRNDTGYNQRGGGTVYGSQEMGNRSRGIHQTGLLGEALVAKYYNGNIDGIDKTLTWTGDDGVDIVFEREDRDIAVDVKTVDWGFEKGSVPYLKVKASKFNAQEVDLYILVEKTGKQSGRIIGHIEPEDLVEQGYKLERGEDIEDHPDFDAEQYEGRTSFAGYVTNLVADPALLTLAKPADEL
ncbi:hypothetical protein N0B31_10180 [Salinirubellus salinus]|uniref:Uncharacterized protein n=1 Tax=Salinirubellus salinus TaxID=1364945 RepID=A0A9E7UCU1_9EURY|nr:hypothetical protein [Salinirubellus salinus]UWM56642.1 hypothetical protein N0B31_10180 [Salinirubellus salinus]